MYFHQEPSALLYRLLANQYGMADMVFLYRCQQEGQPQERQNNHLHQQFYRVKHLVIQ